MAVTAIAPWFVPVFFDNSGNPLSGGTIDTYGAGGSTPLATYSNENLTTPISNPIVLNSAGRPQASSLDTTEVNIYLTAASYKFVLKNSSGTTIRTADNIEALAGIVYVNNAIASQTSPTITTPTIVSPTINTSILSANALLAGVCQGRLTLTSGSPVTTGDVTGATTVYFAPYGGNNIGLYDGSSKWTVLPFSQLSIALGTLTSGLPYDVFVYNNSGTPALRSPVAWSTATARATALTTQDGIYVKTGATTDRYLGTFVTTSTTQTEDSLAKRFVWNYYNRQRRLMRVIEATDSWTYTTATFRQANANTANQLACVVGVAEVAVHAEVKVTASNNGGVVAFYVAIGEDSTSAVASGTLNHQANGGAGGAPINLLVTASLDKYPEVGSHTYVWLEYSVASNTTTWLGDNGGALLQSGISGWIDG